MSEITIRGRIATTSLRRGETVVVEHTEAIDRLIAGGFVEAVAPLPTARLETRQITDDGGTVDEPSSGDDQSENQEPEPEPEPESPRRRKKTSS